MNNLTFWQHLSELRSTFIKITLIFLIAVILGFTYRQPLLYMVVKPLYTVNPLDNSTSLIFLTPFDGFFLCVKLATLSALLIASPFILWLLFGFITPALPRGYNRVGKVFVALSALFIFFGLFFANQLTLPLSMRFFAYFNNSLGVSNVWALSQTLSMLLWIYFAHALFFELICLLFLLIHFRMIKPELLQKARAYVIVAIFFFAALFTPPDALSQIALALPAWLFYELSILYSKMRQKRQKQHHTTF